MERLFPFRTFPHSNQKQHQPESTNQDDDLKVKRCCCLFNPIIPELDLNPCSTLTRRFPVDSFSQNSSSPDDRITGVNVHGTEAFILWSVIISLLIVSLITTGSCLLVIWSLKLIPDQESVLFVPNSDVIFKGDVESSSIHLNQNVIKGMLRLITTSHKSCCNIHVTNPLMHHSSTGISSLSGHVTFDTGTSSLNINPDEGIEAIASNGFRVISPETGQVIFPPDISSIPLPPLFSSLAVTGGAKNVKGIRSPVDRSLRIEGSDMIEIRGNQGVNVDSKIITLDSNSTSVSSTNGSIIMNGVKGIHLGLGKRDVHPSSLSSFAAPSFKLCLCGSSGKIFKLHIRSFNESTCSDVMSLSESNNPCFT